MSDLPKAQFWMVYGVGCGRPTYQHTSRDSAETEAKRLARSNPGTTFCVLEAVTAIRKHEFDVITLRAAEDYDDGIPF
jgi:hypothetical protein